MYGLRKFLQVSRSENAECKYTSSTGRIKFKTHASVEQVMLTGLWDVEVQFFVIIAKSIVKTALKSKNTIAL